MPINDELSSNPPTLSVPKARSNLEDDGYSECQAIFDGVKAHIRDLQTQSGA